MNDPTPRAAGEAPWRARRTRGTDDKTLNAFADWRALHQSWNKSPERPLPRAWACVHWTPATLHFRVLFAGAARPNRARQLNERTWELGDVCEIFLQRENSDEYWEIHVTPDNVRLQLRWPAGGLARLRAGSAQLDEFAIADAHWVASAVQTFPTAWQVDLTIPASALKLTDFSAALRFRAAACSYRYPENNAVPELASTATLGSPFFHQADHWQRVELEPFAQPVTGNTAVVPSLRPDYTPDRLAAWFVQHEETLRDVREARGARLVFIGDSLTAGWREFGRERWLRHFAPLGALNLGIPGDRTQQVLWRLEREELAKISPAAAVILIGTNNIDPGLGDSPSLTPPNTADEIVAGIAKVVDATRQRWPGVRILLLGLLPRGPSNGQGRNAVRAINHALCRRFAAELHFLDAIVRLLEAEAFMPDGIHLSARGYDILAETISATVHSLAQGAEQTHLSRHP